MGIGNVIAASSFSWDDPDVEFTIAVSQDTEATVNFTSDPAGAETGFPQDLSEGVISHTFENSGTRYFADLARADGAETYFCWTGEFEYVYPSVILADKNGTDVSLTVSYNANGFTPNSATINWGGPGDVDETVTIDNPLVAEHTYDDDGDYFAFLQIEDFGGSGLFFQVNFPITEGDGDQDGDGGPDPDPVPTASFSFFPSSADTGESVNLNLASFNADGLEVDGWEVDWNDGDTTTDTGAPDTGTLTSHTWSTPGTYAVTLTVSGEGDDFLLATHNIVISAGAVVFNGDTSLTPADSAGPAPFEVSIEVTADPGSYTGTDRQWNLDMDDGTTLYFHQGTWSETAGSPPHGDPDGESAAHTYSDTGVYNVTLGLTDG